MADGAHASAKLLALVTAAVFTGAADLHQRGGAAGAARPRRQGAARGMEAELRARLRHAGEPGARVGAVRPASRSGRRATGAGSPAPLLIFANWPYTLLVILPVNKRLEATPPTPPTHETRDLIETWGRLHAGRSALGLAATLVYLGR